MINYRRLALLSYALLIIPYESKTTLRPMSELNFTLGSFDIQALINLLMTYYWLTEQLKSYEFGYPALILRVLIKLEFV